MQSRLVRRLSMAALFFGGPVAGWLLNGDRGLLLGLATCVIAGAWFALDERKLF